MAGTRDKYLALFNLGDTDLAFEITSKDMGLESSFRVRDLWKQKDLTPETSLLKQSIGPHDAGMYRISIQN